MSDEVKNLDALYAKLCELVRSMAYENNKTKRMAMAIESFELLVQIDNLTTIKSYVIGHN